MPEVFRCRTDEEIEVGIRLAARAIRAGELVAFPTETVYGLGADATRADAVGAIFEAKQRPPGHPLIVHVDGVARARRLAEAWSERADALADQFWPGPLTLILEKSTEVPDAVTGGLSTVGLRMPDHRIARRLVAASDRPIAAPSANLHRRLSPTRAEHVVRSLGNAVDFVVDGGPTTVGIESTVLTLADDPPTMLRPGMIGREAIEEVVGRIQIDDATEDEGPHRSPGRAEEHYAPEAPLRLADRSILRDRVPEAPDDVGVVWRGGPPDGFDADDPGRAALPDGPSAYAAELYDALHRLDRTGCREIWVEIPPDDDPWRAIRDRLRRAATGSDARGGLANGGSNP